MRKVVRRVLGAIFAIVILMAIDHTPAYAGLNEAELATVVQELGTAVTEIESLNAMRSGLARSLEGSVTEPTLQTFKEVCKPVGMRAKQISQEQGWQVRQVAQKYRNPEHAPANLYEWQALDQFQKHAELTGFWQPETLTDAAGNPQAGIHYYRRIDIEPSCLACHGAKEGRPQFVKERYPQDLAYSFHVGDLRGMYSVFIPAQSSAPSSAQ
ncbi:Tll0287-like domain-containing protein [Trichothermofontia sp.]